MALILRRHLVVRVLAFIALLYTFYGFVGRYRFEKYLDTVQIGFQDFPADYAKALNDSVAEGKQPLDFDYASTFTNPKIPRTIHFIWFKNLYTAHEDVTQMPSVGSRAPELCRQFNPDYEIRMWNATSARAFLETEYAWFLPTYDGYRYPIQRIDALKYFALYHFGGVYMDLDISCRRPLDPLLEFPAWYPEASPLGVNNDLMATAAQHPTMKRMIERLAAYNQNWLFPYLTIFWSTGPHFTSEILRELYRESDMRQPSGQSSKKDADPNTFFVLPQIFYSEQYTFFGHSPGGTWHGSDVAVILWFVAHPWVLAFVLAGIVGTTIALLKRRSRQMKSRKEHTLPV
ncbi:hypothetical protein ACN47E_005136 [Coniothyrium glycines]